LLLSNLWQLVDQRDGNEKMLSRQWKDINEIWLEKYLEEAELMPLWANDPEGAELYEDRPFGWQASWVLSDADWSRLRSAWEHQVCPAPATAAGTAKPYR